MIQKPPCADWKVWIGPEVEGETQRGEPTLFVREATHYKLNDLLLIECPHIKRVWFCEEFVETPIAEFVVEHVLRTLLQVDVALSIETKPDLIESWTTWRKSLPEALRKRISFYFRLRTDWNEGDHICVGPAYSDSIIKIPPASVSPIDYVKDVRIE